MCKLACKRLSGCTQKDPILKIVMWWNLINKVQDLKHLLRDYTTREEGMAILRECNKFMFHHGALYCHHCLAGGLVEAMQFIVLMAHRVEFMNEWHRNAGHQGQQ